VLEGPGHTGAKVPARILRRRRIIFVSAAALLVAAVVVLAVVFAVRDNSSKGPSSTGASGNVTDVTSPYDLHELPAGTGPGAVGQASLVSISIPDANGKSKYYGLSADTDECKALVKAIAGAKEIDASDVVTTTTAGITSGTVTGASTLTFLFPDRSTLAFDLYLAQGIVGRGGDFWKAQGDLEALVQAAITAAGASQ
jgi:hypothetical protein